MRSYRESALPDTWHLTPMTNYNSYYQQLVANGALPRAAQLAAEILVRDDKNVSRTDDEAEFMRSLSEALHIPKTNDDPFDGLIAL